MTPLEILTQARAQYNAVGDNYFGETELLNLLFSACKELAQETGCIKRRYTTTTVANQREYEIPTYTIRIERVTYDGQRLDPIDFTEDDYETSNDENTSSTGTPTYFSQWGTALFLRPTPSAAATLKIYSISMPQTITNTSTLEISTIYHSDTIDFLLSAMFAKDSNYQMSKYHKDLWEDHVKKAKAFEIKRLMSESYKMVKDIDQMPMHGSFDY